MAAGIQRRDRVETAIDDVPLMTVLINCLGAVSGGAISYIRNVIPRLFRLFDEAPAGITLKILAHESQRDLLLVPDPSLVTVKGAQLTGYGRHLWERTHLKRIVDEMNVSVFFTPYQIGQRLKNVKQVFMLRNMEPFFFSKYHYSAATRLRNLILRYETPHCLRRADRVIAVSEYVRRFVIDRLRIDANKCLTIYHGRDISYAPRGEEAEDRMVLERLGIGGNYILTCGSLLPYRRCEDVILSFARVRKEGLRLVIAGSGTDRHYNRLVRQTISDSGCTERVLPVGHVSKEMMQVLYRRALLCVIATEVEACPNIAIETMSSGCAIISSDRPPLPEMFDGSSIQFRSRDLEDLAARMRECLNSEPVRQEFKAKALKRAESFSWDKCARETYAALVDWQ